MNVLENPHYRLAKKHLKELHTTIFFESIIAQKKVPDDMDQALTDLGIAFANLYALSETDFMIPDEFEVTVMVAEDDEVPEDLPEDEEEPDEDPEDDEPTEEDGEERGEYTPQGDKQ